MISCSTSVWDHSLKLVSTWLKTITRICHIHLKQIGSTMHLTFFITPIKALIKSRNRLKGDFCLILTQSLLNISRSPCLALNAAILMKVFRELCQQKTLLYQGSRFNSFWVHLIADRKPYHPCTHLKSSQLILKKTKV